MVDYYKQAEEKYLSHKNLNADDFAGANEIADANDLQGLSTLSSVVEEKEMSSLSSLLQKEKTLSALSEKDEIEESYGPITGNIRKVLDRYVRGGDGKFVKVSHQLARVVVEEALKGNEKMIRLMWGYLEGMPTQVTKNFNLNANRNVYSPEEIANMRKKVL